MRCRNCTRRAPGPTARSPTFTAEESASGPARWASRKRRRCSRAAASGVAERNAAVTGARGAAATISRGVPSASEETTTPPAAAASWAGEAPFGGDASVLLRCCTAGASGEGGVSPVLHATTTSTVAPSAPDRSFLVFM